MVYEDHAAVGTMRIWVQPGAMVTSRSGLQLRIKPGSVVLPQPRSVLMSGGPCCHQRSNEFRGSKPVTIMVSGSCAAVRAMPI